MHQHILLVRKMKVLTTEQQQCRFLLFFFFFCSTGQIFFESLTNSKDGGIRTQSDNRGEANLNQTCRMCTKVLNTTAN